MIMSHVPPVQILGGRVPPVPYGSTPLANARETRDSISLISSVGCLGSISSNCSENSLFKCASQPVVVKNLLKTLMFWISRSFKVIDVGVLVKLVSSAASLCLSATFRILD